MGGSRELDLEEEQSKISHLMATFKQMHEVDDGVDIGDHLEREFLDIIQIFANERKQKN